MEFRLFPDASACARNEKEYAISWDFQITLSPYAIGYGPRAVHPLDFERVPA